MIGIEWQDQFGRWHNYQSKQNQADAYRVAQRRAESTKKRHRLVDSDWRMMDLVNHLQNSTPPGVNDGIACIFHQE